MMSKTKRMHGTFPVTQFIKSGVLYQTCCFCGKAKPISAFPRNGVDKAGNVRYRQDCKVCYNIRRQENANKKRHTNFVGSMKRRGESSVSYTHQQWKETVIFFGGECAYCGRTMRRGEHLTKDHLDPVKNGGLTIQSNIVCACSSCNSSKNDKEWRTWFMQQPFFSQERMNRIFKWRTIMKAAGED